MIKKPTKEIPQKVMEALQEEAYKGIVRIDTQTMRSLSVRPGDIIEIDGGRKTVGIVDRDKIVDGSKIKDGDVILGLPSSGIHSNGYSLVRKVFFDKCG